MMTANELTNEKKVNSITENKSKVPCYYFERNSTKINISNGEKLLRRHEVNVCCSNAKPSCLGSCPRATRRVEGFNKKLPNETLTSFISFLKALVLLFLMCDVFYLHFYVQSVEETLRNSEKAVENLESQMKFTRLSYETFKTDVNYLMYLNRMFTKDINSKIELLVKLNRLFVDHADTSINSIIDILRNQKGNDDEIARVVNRRKTKKLVSDAVETFPRGSIGGDKLDVVVLGNNLSTIVDSFGDEMDDARLSIGNVTVYRKELLQSADGHRSKRQTSNNRGKNRNGKWKNRGQHRHSNCNLFCCSAGPLLAHFRGAQPEAFIQDGGSVIAPWHEDVDVSGDYLNRNAVLREGKAKIEIKEKGLYMIYAQVYYLTSNPLNSFSINIQGDTEVVERVIALCSTEAAVKGMSEVSCYTSVVHHLQPGDKVFLIQRERYRRIIFREGHTFLGIVALNNPPKC